MRRQHDAAFTLLELVAVIGVAIVLLTLALPPFSGWSRAARSRVAVAGVRSALELARARARAFGRTAELHVGETDSLPPLALFEIRQDNEIIGRAHFLPDGLMWTGNALPVVFRADGSITEAGTDRLVFVETDEGAFGQSFTVLVSRVTGAVTVEGE